MPCCGRGALPDRIGVPIDRRRAVSRASLAMVDDTRPTATWLDDALARVRSTTEPDFRPAAVGDGATVQAWCDAVAELDALDGDQPTLLYPARWAAPLPVAGLALVPGSDLPW